MKNILTKFAPMSGSDSTHVASPSPSVSGTKIKVPKWDDSESPSDYFNRCGEAKSYNGTSTGHLLSVYLTGRAHEFLQELPRDLRYDYNHVKFYFNLVG